MRHRPFPHAHTTKSPIEDQLNAAKRSLEFRRWIQAPATKASRLAYDRAGSGEPLILLHGQGFSRRCWDPVIAGLAAHRDVITVGLPTTENHPDNPTTAETPPTTWPSPSPNSSTS